MMQVFLETWVKTFKAQLLKEIVAKMFHKLKIKII